MPATINRAIILMNLGSPDSISVKDVKAYLKEFLMDKRVIDYPYLSRYILINGIIAPSRAPKSAHAYEKVWTSEGSPLIVLTKALQQALQKQVDEPIEIAMRYGKPNITAAFDNIKTKHPEVNEVVLVPLYPHYAMSSYETAVVQAEAVFAKGKYPFKITTIQPYYNNPDYIYALSESIKPYLKDYDLILFSYHGLPERHMRKADITGNHCMNAANCCEVASPAHAHCYRHQCFTTTHLVTELLEIPKEKYSVSFQSRLGREEWLKPYTDFRLKEMPAEGTKKLLIVCPAFVSDCLETLEEIAMQGKETFMNAGGTTYTFIPCMNTQPAWVNTIAKWMKQINADNYQMTIAQ